MGGSVPHAPHTLLYRDRVTTHLTCVTTTTTTTTACLDAPTRCLLHAAHLLTLHTHTRVCGIHRTHTHSCTRAHRRAVHTHVAPSLKDTTHHHHHQTLCASRCAFFAMCHKQQQCSLCSYTRVCGDPPHTHTRQTPTPPCSPTPTYSLCFGGGLRL